MGIRAGVFYVIKFTSLKIIDGKVSATVEQGEKMESRTNEKQENVPQENIKKEELDTEQKITLLYKKYQRLMFWTACDVLHDDYLAEDVVQETFLKLLNNIERIGDVNSSETKNYLNMAAKNMAIDRYRRRAVGMKRELFAEDVENLNQMDAEFSFEELEGNRILDILKALPETYREVCLLKYARNLENKEIAKMLQMREGTVRQKLARGKVLIEQEIHELERLEGIRIL